ncbi:MAG TPA: FHA domain-containing protein [Polyangiaceae bacterium]|nr:FHA domain-containing protein [Polyangiaceae bacterium]
MAGRSLAPPTFYMDGLRRRVWLRFQNQRDFELVSGVTIVGRGDGCQLVLDDPLVSRRHACFVVDDREITIKDLGSTNGVLVNGTRVEEMQVIVPGDQITLGRHNAELCWVPFSAMERGPRPRQMHSGRPAVDTMVDQRPPGSSVPPAPADMFADSESTHETRVLEMLSGVAEKAFELGRGADAERILKRPLESIVERIEQGILPDPREANEAGLLAVRLARATAQASWIDHVFRMFHALERLPTTAIVDELHLAVRVAPGVNIPAFRRYVERMKASQHLLGPNERFLLRRIEGLDGVLGS